MTVRARRFGVVLTLALAALVFATEGRAANILEKLFYMPGPRYDAVVPLCDDSAALGTIQSRFSSKEGRFWNSALTIVSFEDVRETAFMPWVSDTIPRRFCRAVVLVSDGVKRTVYYSIIEDGGIIGMVPGVEWCVVGLDRNWAYSPHCRTAQP
jgi:hypothetical protein